MSGGAAAPDRAASAFVRSLLAPDRTPGTGRELGTTALARRLGLPEDQLSGHWCSRCRGLWFGCALEAECPQCGNRRG